MLLINCKIELDLSWLKDCIVSKILRAPAITSNPAANPPTPAKPATSTTGPTFQINSTKFYVPGVTLSMSDNIKFLKKLQTRI